VITGGIVNVTFKNWLKLFTVTIGLGGLVCVVIGLFMMFTSVDFGFFKVELTEGSRFGAIVVNMLLMLFAGCTIGAFCHMGFFAYLTLNYIALSIFRKKYLWYTIQAYTTIFTLGLVGYLLYENKTNNWFFWSFPLVLAIISLAITYFKVRATKKEAFIPTMFLLVVITIILSTPVLKLDFNLSAVIFMVTPILVCNAYQNHMLGVLTSKEKADSTNSVETASIPN